MKGVVFTELIDHLDEERSPAFTQEVLEAARLPNGGAYTAVGTYPSAELSSILAALSEKTGVGVGDLQQSFGRHLFSRFSASYPNLFARIGDAFSFLCSVETHIHIEVKKLYPDVELPVFEVTERSENRLRIIYRSTRHMEEFCQGLIEGCLDHFGERAEISRKLLARTPATIVEFTLERQPS